MRVDELVIGISPSASKYLFTNNLNEIEQLLMHIEIGEFPTGEIIFITEQEILSLREKIIELLCKTIPYDELFKSIGSVSLSTRSRYLLWLAGIKTISEFIRTNLSDLLSIPYADKELIQEIGEVKKQLLVEYAQFLQPDLEAVSNSSDTNFLVDSQLSSESSSQSIDYPPPTNNFAQTSSKNLDFNNVQDIPSTTTPMAVIRDKLNPRIYNLLLRYKIKTVESFLQQSNERLLSFFGIGEIQLGEINRLRDELRNLPEFQHGNLLTSSKEPSSVDQLSLSQITVSATSISDLKSILSARTYNAIYRYGPDSVADLFRMSEEELLRIRNIGKSAVDEIQSIRNQFSELKDYVPNEILDKPFMGLSQHDQTEQQKATYDLSHFIKSEGSIGSIRIEELALSQTTIRYLQDRNVSTLDEIARLKFSSPSVSTTPISNLKNILSLRVYNALQRHPLTSVEDLLEMSEEQLLQIRNVGKNAVDEIQSIRNHFTAPTDYVPKVVFEELSAVLSCLKNTKQQRATYNLVCSIASEYSINISGTDFAVPDDLSPLSWKYLLNHGYSWEDIEQFSNRLRLQPDLPQVQDLPPNSIITHDTLHFLISIGCPIHQISVRRLVTEVNHKSVLRRKNIETVLDIFLITVDKLENYPELIENIKFYAEWLAKQRNWNDEVSNKQPTPVTLFRLRMLSTQKILGMLFGEDDERTMKIMAMRYGIDDGKTKTLQEVADAMDITRERVRQITQRKINMAKHAFRSSPVLSALPHLAKQYIDANKVLSETDLVKQLQSHLDINDFVICKALVDFVFSDLTDLKICEQLSGRIWISTTLPSGVVQQVIGITLTFLAEKMAPMLVSDIHQHLLGKLDMPNEFVLSQDFVLKCLSAESQLEIVDQKYWGLRRWQNKIHDDLVLLLRELGKPAHFTEITTLINNRLPKEEQVTAHTVHAQLGRYTNLFVRTDSGTFGLREWDADAPIQPPKYVDLMVKVLDQRGKPMTVNEIYEEVNKLRPAKYASISIYLATNDLFVQVGDKYGLATWQSRNDSQEVRETSKEKWLEDLKNDVFSDFWK